MFYPPIRTRIMQRTLRQLELALLYATFMIGANVTHADCYIDPVTGRQVCTMPRDARVPNAPALDSRPSALDSSAHCRVNVDDGTAGSGTLVEITQSTGLVLTCSHLFDTSSDAIVVTFPNGERFAARLIDRDRATTWPRSPFASPITSLLP